MAGRRFYFDLVYGQAKSHFFIAPPTVCRTLPCVEYSGGNDEQMGPRPFYLDIECGEAKCHFLIAPPTVTLVAKGIVGLIGTLPSTVKRVTLFS